MEFITVFRSGDPTAQQDAENARERLAKGGIRAIVLGDDADNLRVDPRTGQVVVGYGSGALAIVEPRSPRRR